MAERRQRVRKGPYNEYLKQNIPFDHAPVATRRHYKYVACDRQDITPAWHSEESITVNETTSLDASEENETNICDSESESNQNESSVLEQLVLENTDNNEYVFEQFREKFVMKDAVEFSNTDLSFNTENETFDDYESDSEETKKEIDKEEDEQPLYCGSNLTLGSTILLIITFAMKFSLTGEGLYSLLQLISLICPSDCILPKSKIQFWKWFDNIKQPLKFHNYCSNCNLVLNDGHIKSGTCPNISCRENLKNETAVSHFIEVSISEQIKKLFLRRSFFKDIQHRFHRKKASYDSIEDVYDGQVYKSLSKEGGVLHDGNNLSLLWNTDGIPCFKSSNMSLWPLFFQINELPYHKRTDPNNMILGGLWLGSNKPSIMSYTDPFIDSLQKLERDGIVIETQDQKCFTCRVFIIGGTADLPARSLVCNAVQFNGLYGCCKCLQPGETCKTSARGHVHVFPFNVDNPEGQLRSHKGTVNDISTAVQNNTVSHGIKGPTFLQCLQYHDLVDGICIDYMHNVLLGVSKLLLKLWFLSEYSSELFSVSGTVDLVDKRLKSVKPPNTISRVPRSIKLHMKYWKASEIRSWMLYYSLPILQDILTEDYYQHYLLFVNAIFLLLQDSISATDLQKADDLLKHFCCLFAALYGERYMTCNVHQLLHLPRMVWNMGPLWSYSCFPFENANGVLLKLYHGTQHVDLQIAQTVCIMQYLPYMEMKYLKPESPEMDFFRELKGISTRKDKYLEDGVYLVGSASNKKIPNEELDIISQYLGHVPINYLSFCRIKIRDEIFHSRQYKRCFARNSHTVAYISENNCVEYGQVEFYMQLYPFCVQHGEVSSDCGCIISNVALLSSLRKTDHNLANCTTVKTNLKHIFAFKSVNKKVVVPVKNILHKCVFVEIFDKPDIVYICRMPNRFERD